MPHPHLIFSQSDYLIQIVDINSRTQWQAVQIQISWLLQKPTDLDLHCLQKKDISGFSRTMVKSTYLPVDFTAGRALQKEQLQYDDIRADVFTSAIWHVPHVAVKSNKI